MDLKVKAFSSILLFVSLVIFSGCTVKVNKTTLNSTTQFTLNLSAACENGQTRFAFFEEAQNPLIKIQGGKVVMLSGEEVCGVDSSSALIEIIDLGKTSRTQFPQSIILATSPAQLINLGKTGIECLYFSAQDGVSGALIGDSSVFYNPDTKGLSSFEAQLALMTHKAETIIEVGNGGFTKECR